MEVISSEYYYSDDEDPQRTPTRSTLPDSVRKSIRASMSEKICEGELLQRPEEGDSAMSNAESYSKMAAVLLRGARASMVEEMLQGERPSTTGETKDATPNANAVAKRLKLPPSSVDRRDSEVWQRETTNRQGESTAELQKKRREGVAVAVATIEHVCGNASQP